MNNIPFLNNTRLALVCLSVLESKCIYGKRIALTRYVEFGSVFQCIHFRQQAVGSVLPAFF